MAGIGNWYPRRCVSSSTYVGRPDSSYHMSGRPIYLPTLGRYVCVWYSSSGAVKVRYLYSGTDLYSIAGGVGTQQINGAFYLGGFVYVIANEMVVSPPSSNFCLYKIDVSSWAATKVNVINFAVPARAAIEEIAFVLYYSGTTAYIVSARGKTDLSQIVTMQGYSIDLSTGTVASTSGASTGVAYHIVNLRLVTIFASYVYFSLSLLGSGFPPPTASFIKRFSTAMSGGIVDWPAGFNAWGIPAYHTNTLNGDVYNEGESAHWAIPLYAENDSITAVIEDATPKFITANGKFYDGATLKHTMTGVASVTYPTDILIRSDGVKDYQAKGLCFDMLSAWNEWQPVGREST
jgi:hypothetical protein